MLLTSCMQTKKKRTMIDIPDNLTIETGLKLLSLITALIAFVERIAQWFSINRKKRELKTDLEILQLFKEVEFTNKEQLIDKINEKIGVIYKDTSMRLQNFRFFLFGLSLFLGFSWWSINLYALKSEFNPWMMLTIFLTSVGFSIMFEIDKSYKKGKDIEKIAYELEIKNKSEFITGISGFLIFGLSCAVIIIFTKHFTIWSIITGGIAILSFFTFLSTIKIREIF